MRITLRIAACAVMLYCMPAHAELSPNWDHGVVARPAVSPPTRIDRQESARPASKGNRASKRPLNLTVSTSHPLIAAATRYIGHGNPTGTRGSWCRDFVNFVAVRAGAHLENRSRRAIDTLTAGRRVKDPRPGDLAVLRHHVTIVVAVRGGEVIGLGGNQGHRVRVSHYALSRVVGFVRVI